MVLASFAIQKHRQRIGEFDRRGPSVFNHNPRVHYNIVISEVAVDSNSVTFVRSDVRTKSISTVVLVLLLCDIIGHFRLEEIGLTHVSIPLNEISESVLRHKSVGSDIVLIND